MLNSYFIKLKQASTGGFSVKTLFLKILQYLWENTCVESTYFEEHLRSAVSKLTLRSDCLELMLSIYLTPTLSSEPRFCMFIISGSYTKNKRLQSLDSSLKDVMIYCCVLFDQTGNTVDKTVQRQHLNQYIKFIYTENVVRLVLFVVLLWPLKI